MGQMLVRALQVCFVGGSRRKIGAEFMVPEDQVLRTNEMPPVMERVDEKPKPVVRKGGRFKRKAEKAEEPAED